MFKVYWTDASGIVGAESYEDVARALAFTQLLRNGSGASFISMAHEIPECVGAQGVDAVIDGKLPSGEDYTWKKRRI